jgi:hypothetical protein
MGALEAMRTQYAPHQVRSASVRAIAPYFCAAFAWYS